MNRRRFLQTAAASAAAALLPRRLGGAPGAGAREGARARPNVLFICVDDLNHWVGYTGRNKQVRTPHIDRLSKMGVSFTNAHCAAPACEPSRAALFSGMRPGTTACYLNGDTWKQHVPEGVSLNATFKKAGYYVAGMGKTYHSSADKGLPSVYASEWDEYPPLPKPSGGGAGKYQGFHEPLPLDLKDDDLGDWHTVTYCIEQFGKKHAKPFFLACGLVKPHLPWAVPRKYYDMFPREGIELPPHIENDLADVPAAGVRMAKPEGDHARFLKSGRWKDAVQSYLATIAYVDVCVGRLLDGLAQSRYAADTLIVLWGDHGWHLGEKEHWRKFALWEEAARAPMIWVAPGVAKAGALCDRPVDFMSIYPTLCDLAGLDIPGHVEGKSLRPLLVDPDAAWDGVAVTTHGYMNHAVRDGRWRYIRYADGSEELYDHQSDPYEWTNLASDLACADVKKQLAARLPTKNAKPASKGGGGGKARKAEGTDPDD
ncbi:MAG: sulfatase [Planctomycetes bacterium]|nr:sulfatase [Planctomycetota bacterium]